MCAAAFVLIVLQILLRLFEPSLVPRGFTTVLIVMLFLGGIQLLSLSVIGSYIAHVYDEVKRRPPFLVESVLRHEAPAEEAAGDAPPVATVRLPDDPVDVVIDVDGTSDRG